MENQPGLAYVKGKLLRVLTGAFFAVYAVVTLFPLYVLFIRTFVGTIDSTVLHLWIPPARSVNLDAEIGNLAVFYNLDLREFKRDFGLSPDTYLNSRMTLKQFGAEYGIPAEHIEDYFEGYSTFNGWITLFSGTKLPRALANSLGITLLSMIGINFLSLLTGYGLAGLRRRDQLFIYNLYLLQMVIPPMLVIIPQFMMVQWILDLLPNGNAFGMNRAVGQFLALVVINVRGGALTTMIYTTAITAIPREIEEASEIDGASRLQYLRFVLLPLLKVPMATVSVILLPVIWNQFLEPYIYLDSQNTTLTPLVVSFSGAYSSNFQVIYTAVFISVIPLLMIYLLFRKQFIQGALAGAVKG